MLIKARLHKRVPWVALEEEVSQNVGVGSEFTRLLVPYLTGDDHKGKKDRSGEDEGEGVGKTLHLDLRCTTSYKVTHVAGRSVDHPNPDPVKAKVGHLVIVQSSIGAGTDVEVKERGDVFHIT